MHLKYKYRHGLMHTTPHRGPSIHWFAPSFIHPLTELLQSCFNQHLMGLKRDATLIPPWFTAQNAPMMPFYSLAVKNFFPSFTTTMLSLLKSTPNGSEGMLTSNVTMVSCKTHRYLLQPPDITRLFTTWILSTVSSI